MKKALITIAIIVLLDQISKIYVKLNFKIGEAVHVLGDWFQIRFIENPGMAWGTTIDIPGGKYILTFFRIIVFGIGIWYIRQRTREGVDNRFIYAASLVLAGALGNIIDCVFYGQLFTASDYSTLATFASGNGYAPVFMGQVVDMLYFPIIRGHYPEFMGGGSFIFFRPIFNLADMAISIGIGLVFLNYKRFFPEQNKPKKSIQPDQPSS